MPKPTDPDYIPSFSFLKGAFGPGRTPAKELYKREQPRTQTAPQFLGTVVEDFICLPDFWGKYVLLDLEDRPKPDMTMNAKANREWLNEREAWAADKGLVSLSADIYQTAFGIKQRLQDDGCPFIDRIAEYQMQVEVIGELDGIKYRGFADAMDLWSVVDLKTCTDAGKGFEKQMRQNFVATQLALYMHASERPQGQVLALEVKPPYDWQIWELWEGTEQYDKALSFARQWLVDFKRWSEMGCPEIGPQFWVETKEIDLYKF